MKLSSTKIHGILPGRYAQRKSPEWQTAPTPTVCPVWCTVRIVVLEWDISVPKQIIATHYDSDPAFQCGNYRSKSGECVSHYVKTSVLEAAILQAIQAVSKYVLENEDECIQQLKAVWNEQQTRTANNGYQELAEAKKRMAELDEKINKLYESTLSGLLPERQAHSAVR